VRARPYTWRFVRHECSGGRMFAGDRSITMVRSTIPRCSISIRMPCLTGPRDHVAYYVRAALGFFSRNGEST